MTQVRLEPPGCSWSSRMGKVALGLALATAACAAPRLERREYTDRAMGVGARVILFSDDAEAADRAAGCAFERIRRLDEALSDWDPSSELSRVVARAGAGPVAIGADLSRNLRLALRLARASDGVLDPTLAPLVALWRESRHTRELPTAAALREARARVGWHRVTLDADGRFAALEPETRLDLGATAKGDACDEALAVLARLGFRHALVELGGDLAVGAAPPGRAGWRIALDCGPRRRTRVVENAGVATSGAALQFVEIDGRRYAHLVDPRTGLGATDASCATVVAPRAALADGLATIASLLGPDAAPAVLARIAPEARVHFALAP